jgi:cytoskeleton protein RodZ
MNRIESPLSGAEPAIEPRTERVASVGEQLRRARQSRRLDVTDIAQTLKLGVRQVEAMENDHWQALPGQTFIRGIVRNYARLVEMDPAPLMAQLDSLIKQPEEILKVSGHKAADMPQGSAFGAPRRDRMVVIFGLILVLVAALAYFLFAQNLASLRDAAQSKIDSFAHQETSVVAPADSASAPGRQPAPSEPVFPPADVTAAANAAPGRAEAELAPAAPPSPPTAATPKVSAVASPPAALEAAPQMLRFLADKPSWVEVRDRNSRVVFSERLMAGTERSLAGDGPLSLVIGYAPGVKIFLRGELIDLAPHSRGDVARLVLE